MTTSDRSPEIEALIAEFERSGMRELHIRSDAFELYLSNEEGSPGIVKLNEGASASRSAPIIAATPRLPVTKDAAVDAAVKIPDGATIIAAPYLGTFYRAPKPGAETYVEIDNVVTAETELCLVEVMKLFTAVRAGTAGRIVAILADDGQMVQANQPLFAIMAD